MDKTDKTERVLVVPTKLFHEVGYFQGFHLGDYDKYVCLMNDKNILFIKREMAECDPDFKQLIPYLIITGEDDNGNLCVFHYTRSKIVGEQRLEGKMSIGVGGHINPVDHIPDALGKTVGIYQRGMERELSEEVKIDCNRTFTYLGVLNDDTNEVGQVHLGLIWNVHVKDINAVESNEPDLVECGWLPTHELSLYKEHMETWSRILVEALCEKKDEEVQS